MVVNNSPASDDLLELNLPFPTSFIDGEEGDGFSKGCNRAFDELIKQNWQGWIWLLNPDISLKHANSIEKLQVTLSEISPDTLVGTAVFDDSGELEKSAGWIDPGLDFRRKRVSKKFFESNIKDQISVDWISGCSMLLCLSDNKVKLRFDSNFPLYYEDMDLCLRHAKSGSPIIWLPSIKVTHTKGQGSRTSPNRRIRLSTCSYIRFLQRYRPGLVLFLRTVRILLKALFRLPIRPQLTFATLQGIWEAFSQPIV